MRSISPIIRRFYSTNKKRFYKEVSVISDSNNSYEVCLDGKKLKTQNGNIMKLPCESLALAIAHEWSSQRAELHIGSMRLTGLAFTVIDNPLHVDRTTMIGQILDYLDTDTVFYTASEPDSLVQLQQLHWGRLLQWTNATFGLNIAPTDSILTGPVIGAKSRMLLQRHLASYNHWSLIGFQYAVEAVKSLLIVLATVAHRLAVNEAVEIATLEQSFQTETWGNVEWGHDFEKHELRSRVAAGVLFVQLASNFERTISKNY